MRNVEGRKITNILKVVHFIRDQSHEPRERERERGGDLPIHKMFVAIVMVISWSP